MRYFLLLALATQLHASEWMQINKKSDDGVTLTLDFLIAERDEAPPGSSPVKVTRANPVWIHIQDASLKTSDKVRVDLINYSYNEL